MDWGQISAPGWPPLSEKDLDALAFMRATAKPVVMLRPVVADEPLPPGTSKMGGVPDLPPDLAWPDCPTCKVPLNFVLQLHASLLPAVPKPRAAEQLLLFDCAEGLPTLREPEFPFPAAADQFVLFRCPKGRCHTRSADRFLWWRYVASAECRPRPIPVGRPASGKRRPS